MMQNYLLMLRFPIAISRPSPKPVSAKSNLHLCKASIAYVFLKNQKEGFEIEVKLYWFLRKINNDFLYKDMKK